MILLRACLRAGCPQGVWRLGNVGIHTEVITESLISIQIPCLLWIMSGQRQMSVSQQSFVRRSVSLHTVYSLSLV